VTAAAPPAAASAVGIDTLVSSALACQFKLAAFAGLVAAVLYTVYTVHSQRARSALAARARGLA
jgi:hypothetical protein